MKICLSCTSCDVMPGVCGAAEDVQGGVVLPVVRVQL